MYSNIYTAVVLPAIIFINTASCTGTTPGAGAASGAGRGRRPVRELNASGAHGEPCVGSPEFCNLTLEEYVGMLDAYVYPQPYEWALIATHGAVFVAGLLGNALVCVAVYRNHTMRTVTNYFIVNLAVADFMVLLFCLPPTVLWDVTETWFLGDALCKTLLYFQSVSVTVSVLTLTFISLDRWHAICFPLEFKSTTGRATTAILLIWTVSLLFNIPELVVLTTVKTVPLRFGLQYLVQCMATWSPTSDLVWHIIKVLFIYTIPLLLMTVAYHQIVRVLWRSDHVPGRAAAGKPASAEHIQLRSRRKAAKMLVAVVAMFAVCYFPVHLLSVLRYTVDMEQSDAVTCLALLSHVMCYANSAVNPLIYNFMSGKYRREFRRALCCCGGGAPGAAGGAAGGVPGAGRAAALTGSTRASTRTSTRTSSRTSSRSWTRSRPRARAQYVCHPAAASAARTDAYSP